MLMENYDTNAIEKLVNKMADSYDYPDEKLVSQMNELTGRSWSAKDCWEYTCEYWSHNSLHETVYALINGDYPPYNENEYYVWNAKRALEAIIPASEAVSDVLEETHLFFRLGRYKKITGHLKCSTAYQLTKYISILRIPSRNGMWTNATPCP